MTGVAVSLAQHGRGEDSSTSWPSCPVVYKRFVPTEDFRTSVPPSFPFEAFALLYQCPFCIAHQKVLAIKRSVDMGSGDRRVQGKLYDGA
jgi:hypothetical protein